MLQYRYKANYALTMHNNACNNASVNNSPLRRVVHSLRLVTTAETLITIQVILAGCTSQQQSLPPDMCTENPPMKIKVKAEEFSQHTIKDILNKIKDYNCFFLVTQHQLGWHRSALVRYLKDAIDSTHVLKYIHINTYIIQNTDDFHLNDGSLLLIKRQHLFQQCHVVMREHSNCTGNIVIFTTEELQDKRHFGFKCLKCYFRILYILRLHQPSSIQHNNC